MLAVVVVAALAALGAVLFAWRRAQSRGVEAAAEAARTRDELEARTKASREALAEVQGQLEDARRERDELQQTAQRLARQVEDQQTTLHDTREQFEAKLREQERALEDERNARMRLAEARRLEQQWVRELRGRVMELQSRGGGAGDTHDVRALVLRIGMSLLEARKGLLLARADVDADGRLDLACAEGFEHDPAESAVAQRFASEVLERDQTVRENDAADIDRERRTPADEEIENLVAIPIYVQDRFSGVLVCANTPGGFDAYDDEVLLALGDQAGAALENNRLHDRMRASHIATVRMLAEALEAKDPFLRGHSDHASSYVAALAERLGFDAKRREELLFASLLHDIGMIGISERILLKPGPLTQEEKSIVELHPRIGYRLVEQLPDLSPIALHVLHHHERFDGSGYPGRLTGEQIPLEARIISVISSFSAMTAERPHSHAMSVDAACAELERCAGTQFDPELVRIFVEQVRKGARDGHGPHSVFAVLADPEIGQRRSGGEPVLGYGGYGMTDNLTLLYSHGHFQAVARAEAERAAVQNQPFAVVLFELTDIDAVNHAEGYAAGDEALKTCARAVQRAAARYGGTPGRYSGRRLGLIVPGADETEGRRIAAELSAELYDDPSVRYGVGSWRVGDAGYDVVARARAELGGERVLGLEELLAQRLPPDDSAPAGI